MYIKPIPLKLLNDKAILRPFIKDTRDGKEYGKDIKLTNISLSHTAKYSGSNKSQYTRHNAVLFYDTVNSSPKNMEFKEKDMIIYNGKKMIVERVVTPNWTSQKIHHYELELFEPIRN